MAYAVIALAFLAVGLAVALARMSGKLAEARQVAETADGNALVARAAAAAAKSDKEDEVGRLRRALEALHHDLDVASADIVASGDPVARRARLAELAKKTKIVLGQTRPIAAPDKKDGK